MVAPRWTIMGFTYHMENAVDEANIYLAQSQDGTERLVQFWWGNEAPTPYHGDWASAMGPSGVEAYAVWFNGRGPPRPLHKAEVYTTGPRRGPHGEMPPIMQGVDYAMRRITMEHFGTWLVNRDLSMQMLWAPPPHVVILDV